MRLGRGSLVAVVVLTLAVEADAQVLQLPSFHSFGVDTTVVVPDSGGARAGDNKRGSSSLSRFGGNRGVGLNRQASGAHVTVQIHDPPVAAREAVRVPTPRAAGDPPAVSLLEIDRRQSERALVQQRESTSALVKGRRALAAGKPSVAAVYYRTAARAASGKLRARIQAEWSDTSAASVPAADSSARP